MPALNQTSPQAAHFTRRPDGPMAWSSAKNRVAHLGQVSIIAVSDRSSGSQSRSLIFSRMSRNLAPTEPVSGGEVARVEGVYLSPPDLPVRAQKVSFTVGATSLLFLVGPAGSGKSAILDLLSFASLPARGRVHVLGVDVTHLAPSERPRMRRRIGLLFQEQRWLPDLDVFANVALAARVARRRARDYAPEVGELLTWVGLGGRGSDRVSRLTEGERRRLGLARALINRPDLLIADEPTSGLGGKSERAMFRLIAEVNAAGTPVVVATRDRSLALSAGGSIHDLAPPEVS
jgi:cell division transport system ATP-binding protein